ncbi:MAG: tRNA lysidine(34) synthetase TilS, partial [Actinomycetota bacterium]
LALAVAAGCEVEAVHVDHGLRAGSQREADRVRAVADRLGAGFRAVGATVEDGPNLEERARAARHRALPDGALLGHTMDDQAETMLLNLLRGSGPRGMAAMRADGSRPLLQIRRAETQLVCRELGIEWICDPSNEDRRFRRNRVRHDLLPLLGEVAERDVVPVLARQAELFRDEDELLDALAAELDPTDAAALRRAPVAQDRTALRARATGARRAVRSWIVATTGSGHPPDAATVGRALDVAANRTRACEIGDGWRLARTEGRLRLERSGSVPAP